MQIKNWCSQRTSPSDNMIILKKKDKNLAFRLKFYANV